MRSHIALGGLTALVVLALSCTPEEENVEQDLGTYTTDTGGLTGEISFDLPDNATSALLHCGPYGDNLLGTAWTIRDDDNALWYANQFHDEHSSVPMRVGNHDDYLPVLLPVSPDHDISGGTWCMNVWVAAGGAPVDVSCSAVVRTQEPAQNATVDLHFVMVGVAGLDAGSADNHEGLQGMIDAVDGIWSNAGLAVGSVSYEDFSGDTIKYSVLDIDSSEYNDLLRTADTDGKVLTIFLVDEITTEGGSTVFGIAAGPPGAATVTGTSKSGMVVGAGELDSEADFVALVTAHEGAHFLGLFHTSEKDGGSHDPLSDTAECPASADTNGNGRVDQDECAGSGADNVMFWSPAEGTTDLSGDQGWVLRRNPAVQ